jgi:hypothetical protein
MPALDRRRRRTAGKTLERMLPHHARFD